MFNVACEFLYNLTWISSIIYCVALPNLSQIRAFLWLKRILIGIVYSTSRLIYKCYLIALRCLKFVCESKRKFPIFLFFLKHKCCCFFLLCTFCTGLIFGNGIFCKNFGIDFQNTGKITTSFIAKSIKLQLKVYQYFGTLLHPNNISQKFSVVNNNQSLWYKLLWAWS